jgi:hypothetical protein
MHVLADGVLLRSLPSPIPVQARPGRTASGWPVAAWWCHLGRCWCAAGRRKRGQVQVAGERVPVGLANARQLVTVRVAEHECRFFDQGGLIKTIPPRHRQEVTRFKAHKRLQVVGLAGGVERLVEFSVEPRAVGVSQGGPDQVDPFGQVRAAHRLRNAHGPHIPASVSTSVASL